MTKVNEVRQIIVAGTSDIKIAATKKAVYELILKDVEVESIKIGSTGINEQPVGESEILEGAMKRAKLAKEADDSTNSSTIYLGIENGIEEQTPHNWFDYAFIYGIFPKGEKVTKTIRCFFPEECVIATSLLPGGFKDNTVGKYMASIGLVRDPADPHVDLCGFRRTELLKEAIKDILISPKDGSGINTCC